MASSDDLENTAMTHTGTLDIRKTSSAVRRLVLAAAANDALDARFAATEKST